MACFIYFLLLYELGNALERESIYLLLLKKLLPFLNPAFFFLLQTRLAMVDVSSLIPWCSDALLSRDYAPRASPVYLRVTSQLCPSTNIPLDSN